MTALILGTGSVSAQNINLVAGTTNGFSGDGALATSAQPNTLRDVAVDSAGNVNVADSSNNRIRKITVATGVITTLAGTGASGFAGDGGLATSAQLGGPNDVILDSVGNICIADASTHRIRKITVATGMVTTLAGGGEFLNPAGIALDAAGDIYVSDFGNCRVR